MADSTVEAPLSAFERAKRDLTEFIAAYRQELAKPRYVSSFRYDPAPLDDFASRMEQDLRHVSECQRQCRFSADDKQLRDFVEWIPKGIYSLNQQLYQNATQNLTGNAEHDGNVERQRHFLSGTVTVIAGNATLIRGYVECQIRLRGGAVSGVSP